MLKSNNVWDRSPEPIRPTNNVACWSENAKTQTLRLELQDGHFFVFPYLHFSLAEFIQVEGGDLLKLTFGTHEVKISGRGLAVIGQAFQTLAVEWIKEIPPKYAGLQGSNTPFVASIAVAQLSDRG